MFGPSGERAQPRRRLVTASRIRGADRRGFGSANLRHAQLWEGAVTLPHPPGRAARYRLAIAEYEEYLVDDAMPYDRMPTRKDRRIVFIEYVEQRWAG